MYCLTTHQPHPHSHPFPLPLSPTHPSNKINKTGTTQYTCTAFSNAHEYCMHVYKVNRLYHEPVYCVCVWGGGVCVCVCVQLLLEKINEQYQKKSINRSPLVLAN